MSEMKVKFCQNWILLEFCTVVRCFEAIDESSSSWLGSDASMMMMIANGL